MTIPTDKDLQRLGVRLGDVLHGQQLSLVTAESCTGGWVGKILTDISGSSGWYDRGFITYTNQSKTDLLNVPASLIEQHGAVSEAVVKAMAKGALHHSHANIALSITGIAGPAGGSKAKPVGLVWFGWADDHQISTESRQFDGDREAVRRQACAFSLHGVLNLLNA